MENKKRITVHCWNPDCPHPEYSWLATFDGQPVLYISCPFCRAEAVIDLAPFTTTVRQTMAGEGDAFALQTLNLPDVVPSEPRPPTDH